MNGEDKQERQKSKRNYYNNEKNKDKLFDLLSTTDATSIVAFFVGQ